MKSDFGPEKFIIEVENHSAVWDMGDDDYVNRDIKDIAPLVVWHNEIEILVQPPWWFVWLLVVRLKWRRVKGP